MKHIKLNIRLLSTLLFVLGLIACTNDDINNSQKEIIEGLPTTVSLKLSSATPMVVETKAAGSEGQFRVINNLAILVYKTETGALDKATLVAGLEAKEWNGTFKATTGERRIYVLANHSLTEEQYKTESELLKSISGLIDATITPTGDEQMLGMFGEGFTDKALEITLSETPVNLSARLYPPYSKITFTIKNETTMSERVVLNIKNVSVRNLPTRYSLLPLAAPLGTEANVNPDKTELSGTDDVYEFYMYENPQGTKHETNKDPKLKSPFEDLPSETSKIDYADWDAKWATKTPCTYIEIEGSYTIWKSEQQNGSGTIHYRFFLGEDAVKDFNIKRNTHYKVDLVFKGTAGYNELKYEWRVNADLTDVTIVPEGTLEIDGSPDCRFPFYVVNSSGEVPNIVTKLSTNMKLYYIDSYNTEQTVTDLGKYVPKKGVLNCGVYSEDFGILGDLGHRGDNSYIHEETGTKYERYTSDNSPYPDNKTYRKDVGLGKIYRTNIYTIKSKEEKKFTVKEYPLLCLYDNTEINGTNSKKTAYAQRIDRNDKDGKKTFTKEEAKNICNGDYSGKAAMHRYLPTVSDLTKMIEYEKYFAPKSGSAYWTTEGLYNWTENGPVLATGETGYVRCVYKHYESTIK